MTSTKVAHPTKLKHHKNFHYTMYSYIYTHYNKDSNNYRLHALLSYHSLAVQQARYPVFSSYEIVTH